MGGIRTAARFCQTQCYDLLTPADRRHVFHHDIGFGMGNQNGANEGCQKLHVRDVYIRSCHCFDDQTRRDSVNAKSPGIFRQFHPDQPEVPQFHNERTGNLTRSFTLSIPWRNFICGEAPGGVPHGELSVVELEVHWLFLQELSEIRVPLLLQCERAFFEYIGIVMKLQRKHTKVSNAFDIAGIGISGLFATAKAVGS
jgi:hypothetical protein